MGLRFKVWVPKVDEIAVLYIDSVFSDRLFNTPADQVDAPDTGISVRALLASGEVLMFVLLHRKGSGHLPCGRACLHVLWALSYIAARLFPAPYILFLCTSRPFPILW